MDLDNLSPEQMEKAFKLCDIMSLQDIFVATAILESYNWDLQVSSNSYFKKAVDEIALNKQQQGNKKTANSMSYQQKWGSNDQQNENKEEQKPQLKPNLNEEHNTNQNYNYRIDFDDQQDPYGYSYGDLQNQEGVDYQDYEYQYADSELEKKKKIFEQNFAFQIPLNKTISEPHQMIKSLERDKVLAQDYHRHRHQYQSNLLSKSEFICDKILEANPQKKNLYTENKKKLLNNKKFIVHLHKHYKSKINFTFGTFLLNLIRSHLDGKYLLVFIHHSNNQNNNKIVERILVQPEIAQFVNKNCVSYGMFDNSDDYQIIQKYVPLKNLPAFALFKYNKKQQKEQFINSYSIMSNQMQNCLQWMSKWMGVFMKKKPKSQNQIKKETENEKAVQYQKLSEILKDQNWEYEQMERLYKMKRLQSKLNKEQRKKKEQQINEKAKYFESNPEPSFQQGVSIEIKFRMPISGQSKLRIFKLNQKVQVMFDYIECFHQEQFQQAFSQFDLTQTFPTLSLKDKRQQKIQQIFGDSPRQNIIVKEV